MATDATTEQRPIRAMTGGQRSDGTMWDGKTILHPGDEGYDEALRQARRFSEIYGVPIPFVADEQDQLSRTPAGP